MLRPPASPAGTSPNAARYSSFLREERALVGPNGRMLRHPTALFSNAPTRHSLRVDRTSPLRKRTSSLTNRSSLVPSHVDRDFCHARTARRLPSKCSRALAELVPKVELQVQSPSPALSPDLASCLSRLQHSLVPHVSPYSIAKGQRRGFVRFRLPRDPQLHDATQGIAASAT